MDDETILEERSGEDAELPTVISNSGDLLLYVLHDLGNTNTQTHAYRVETSKLRRTSRFFDRLLSGPFAEAQRVAEELEHLRGKHNNVAEASVLELPSITIKDVGRVSVSKGVQQLMADLLRALHGQAMEGKVSVVPNIANLAVVADRLDALPSLSEYVRRHKLLRGKEMPESKLSEERLRQKIYVGILLEHEAWVTSPSQRLITRGSERWKPDAEDTDAACWWNLPRGLEEELQYRRECLLDSLGSLQLHFIELYTSRERQCKLGYDSSPQCDAFQLGEMMRFFSRLSLLRVQNAIYSVDMTPHIFTGDIYQLIGTLRQCPSYQIDNNHTHCGLRARLIPILDLIEQALAEVGICAECWQQRRDGYAWSTAKRLPIWRRAGPQGLRMSGRKGPCANNHLAVKDMFTAVLRDWTARDAYGEEVHRDHLSSGMKLVR